MDIIAAFDYGSDVHNTEVKSLQAYWSQSGMDKHSFCIELAHCLDFVDLR